MPRSEKWRSLFDELGLVSGKDLFIPDDIHELIFKMRDGSSHTIRSLDDKPHEDEWRREIKGNFFISWRRHDGNEIWVDDRHTAAFGGSPWVAETYILMDDITEIIISRKLQNRVEHLEEKSHEIRV